MHHMRAERTTTVTGSGRCWHVLERGGSALCGKPLTGRPTLTLEAALEREDYCPRCMEKVAAAVGTSLAGVPTDAERGKRRA
ncbi:hypothetical protein OG802_00370 [Streptomyces sp. NBC_00704]|uniref:hypothetical protein n=1 Tax=Streptomyces sp. NBC_00704 TaxID=2975809 RepID=UPI002E30307A|nr:hypothetical protein [Streptomyces sp. NBC_00704]